MSFYKGGLIKYDKYEVSWIESEHIPSEVFNSLSSSNCSLAINCKEVSNVHNNLLVKVSQNKGLFKNCVRNSLKNYLKNHKIICTEIKKLFGGFDLQDSKMYNMVILDDFHHLESRLESSALSK